MQPYNRNLVKMRANEISCLCLLKILRVAFLVLGCIVAVQSVHAQNVPFAVGFVGTLSGSDAGYGKGLLQGAQLALKEANTEGGPYIELLVLDDEGDPNRAAANAKQLLQEGVVALTGTHGAPRTLAVANALRTADKQEPIAALVGPATSADTIRSPPLPGVFHLRAGAAEEAGAAVTHLDTIGIQTFALLAQDGDLGDSVLESINVELARIAIRPIASERLGLAATNEEISSAIKNICSERPQTLILAINPARINYAVDAARKLRCGYQFVVFSETGAALAQRGRQNSGNNILVTQIVPSPTNQMHPLVAAYTRSIRTHEPSMRPSYPSLEGYLAMNVLVKAIKTCGKVNQRDCLLRSLRTNTFDAHGIKVNFGEAQRQKNPFVEITLFDSQGRFRR
jgi:branched-chain amino acid transport system substrate-binding protein